MKSLAILCLFFAFSAHAGPAPAESVSLTCNATVLAPGGQGATGPITINASTPGIYLNAPWTINVGFQGGAIMAPGSACGAPIEAGLNCDSFRDGSGNKPFVLVQRCGDVGMDPGVPRAPVEASIVIDDDHGYIYCSNRNGGDTYHVRLSDCK